VRQRGYPSGLTNSILADANNTILVSAAVACEVAIKASLGKLNALPLAMDLSNRIIEEGFVEAPRNFDQATRAGLLPCIIGILLTDC